MPTKPGYFERHSLNDKPIKIAPNVPPQMGSDAYPPPMTPWGKAKFDAAKVSYGPEPSPRERGMTRFRLANRWVIRAICGKRI